MYIQGIVLIGIINDIDDICTLLSVIAVPSIELPNK